MYKPRPMDSPRHRPAAIFSPCPTTKSGNQSEMLAQNKSDSAILTPGSNKKPLAGPSRTQPVKRTLSLNRSRTTTATLSLKENNFSPFSVNEKSVSSAKVTKFSPRTVERNPVTNYCTPRRSKDLNRSNPRHLPPSGGGSSIVTKSPRPFPRLNGELSVAATVSSTPDYFSRVQIDTPANKTISDEILGEESSNLTVGVRVRPFSSKESTDPAVTNVVDIDGSDVIVKCENGTTHTFAYDYCFSSCDPDDPNFANQDAVFSTMVHPLVDTAFKGYNACLFAYGQTGSGKSYSMMGTDIDTGSCVGRNAGIIPRFCFELFERVASLNDSRVSGSDVTTNGSLGATVEISYFEIYNEKIHDLLGSTSDGGKRPPLKVREHPVLGPYVVDLSLHTVDSYESLAAWLAVGNRQRATAATGMNEKSSRSHSIFSLVLTQTQGTTGDNTAAPSCRSKVNLVDLAGSERLSHTCAGGDRLREGVSINRSLLTLGKVIASLSENASNRRRGFVPYRDSVLTWLLRESLGGNSRTAMLATISPTNHSLDETLATLRYACQARTIVNRVHVNENPQDRVIRELRLEVERLRSVREDVERRQMERAANAEAGTDQVGLLRDQLKQSEKNLADAEKSWCERLAEAERCKSEEQSRLRRCGVALRLDWDGTTPCLVNLAADPALSGTLLYALPPGTARIGREPTDGADFVPDIALRGPLVYQQHCTIENVDGHLTLRAGHRGETYVNGEVVSSGLLLHHGDRLVIGGNHFFRVSVPAECTATEAAEPVDFEFAQREIARVQEEKLRAELDSAKRRAVAELEMARGEAEALLETARKEAELRLERQRNGYEETISKLGSELTSEQLALAEAQKAAERMEQQIRALKEEMISERQGRLTREDSPPIVLSPYQSNFLQDVEILLNESCVETDSAPKTTPSSETTTPIALSLYEMDLMTQEATRTCADIGVNYAFSQQQVLRDGRLAPMVRVHDRAGRSLLWTPEHFVNWLERLRHFDATSDSIGELLDVDESWEVDDDNEDLDQSRISVDMRSIKQQLNESFSQLADSSMRDDTYEANATGNSTLLFQDDELLCYVDEMSETLGKMRWLCSRRGRDINVSLDGIEKRLDEVRAALAAAEPSEFEDTSTRLEFVQPDPNAQPTKSNLRSPTKTLSKKTVRFIDASIE